MKQKGHESTLEETQPDHAVSSAVTAKLLLHCVIRRWRRTTKRRNGFI